MPTLTRILHVAHGIPSYHNSLLELANRLRNSDIELIIASHSDLSEVLQAQGHTFIHLRADVELERSRQLAMNRCRSRRGPSRWVSQYVQSRHYRQLSLHSQEFPELVNRIQPQLLLIDMECHKAIIQAHASTLPLVLLSRWYTVFRQGNNPPMHTLLRPAQSLVEGLRIRLSWIRLGAYKMRLSLLHSLSRQRFRPVSYASNARPALSALAKATGVNPSTITDTSHWLIPHIYRQLPVVSLTLEMLELSNSNDPRMYYAGAMVGKQNAYHPDHAGALQQLQSFTAQRKHLKNPLVYCSLSTFWNTEQDLLAAIIALFTRRTDLDLVLGLGGRQPADSRPDITDNILLLDYAPQLEVLHHSNLAITHGGVSTINEALVNGVPLIVCSSGHVDQNGCTVRVVENGVGLSCPVAPLNIIELERMIDYMLGSEGAGIRNTVLNVQAAQQRANDKNLAIVTLADAAQHGTCEE